MRSSAWKSLYPRARNAVEGRNATFRRLGLQTYVGLRLGPLQSPALPGGCAGYFEHPGAPGAGSYSGILADLIACLTSGFRSTRFGNPPSGLFNAPVCQISPTFSPFRNAMRRSFLCRSRPMPSSLVPSALGPCPLARQPTFSPDSHLLRIYCFDSPMA